MTGPGPVLSTLQDAWGYLWFVAADGGRFGDPDIPWGYGDPSLCQELRDLGSAGLLRRNVVERVNMYAPWYWASTIASMPLRRLEKMRATQLAFELVTAAKRINHGVFSPNGFLVFGNAQMDSGFSVRAASVDFSDDLREDVQTFWQDHMMELGHRNGPALLAHQIVKRLEDSWGMDTLAVEQMSELVSQGAFDVWLEDPIDSPARPIRLSSYGASESLAVEVDGVMEPLRSLMRSIYVGDPPWLLYRAVMTYVRSLASVLVPRDVYPDFPERGVARSCRGRGRR